MVWFGWLALAMLGAGAFFWLYACISKKHSTSGAHSADNPVSETPAIVSQKKIVKESTGSNPVPGHRLAYQVLFQLPEGKQLPLEVQCGDFARMQVGQRGQLVTQNNLFMAFDE